MTDLLLDTFHAHRGRLFGIAYRMLGTVADAEDVLQDAWLRWQGTDRDAVREPAAFLSTIVTRLALTALDSARARREVYVGPWLPEPILTGGGSRDSADPSVAAEHAESLSLAVLLLLERLSPAERAAYVLHEAFDYPFRQVAEVLETSEANARQLASRARAHLDRERGAVVTAEEHDRMLGAFIAASQSGDLASLEALFTEQVQSVSDGGGVVSAARRVVGGRAKVALSSSDSWRSTTRASRAPRSKPTARRRYSPSSTADRARSVTVDVAPDGLRSLFAVLNPHKLGAFAEIATAVTSGGPAQS